MPGHGNKLSRKQEQAIAALLTESSVEAAADLAGISHATLKNWLKLPSFVSAYRAARREVVESALGKIQQATGEAVDTLKRNLTSGQPGQEIRAAVAILDHAVKAVEVLDLTEQLAGLKLQIEELKHGRPSDAQGDSPAEGGSGPVPANSVPAPGETTSGPGQDSDRGEDASRPLAGEFAAFPGQQNTPALFASGG